MKIQTQNRKNIAGTTSSSCALVSNELKDFKYVRCDLKGENVLLSGYQLEGCSTILQPQ